MKVQFFGIFVLLLFVANSSIKGQCTNCENPVNTGTNASAIGTETKATGHSSFASGLYSIAEGDGSTAMGFRNFSSDIYTTTLGNFLKATESHAMVIGDGFTQDYELINNNSYSLMIGFKSIEPTLFVSSSPDYNKTGKVAIGNMTLPLAKLHIYSDDNEPATLFLEPSNWTTTYKAEIWLGNQNHGIGADVDEGMMYQTEKNHVFKGGDVYIEDIDKGIIMKSSDGRCWRGTLGDNGSLNFAVLDECPGVITSNPENSIEKTGTEVKFYPNPGTDVLTIQTKTYPCLLEMYNANGQSVLTKTLDRAFTNLDTNHLPAGAYTWIITKDGRLIGNDKWIKASKFR